MLSHTLSYSATLASRAARQWTVDAQWSYNFVYPVKRTFHKESHKWRATAEPRRKEKEEKFEIPDFFDFDTNPAALELLFESAEILKQARHYEVVFLVHEDRADELGDVIQKVKDFIEEKKGKIHRLNDWGMRKLAYKIQKAKRANYILMNFQIDAKEINNFKALLDKDERVIRHLVITMKKAETAQTIPPPEYSTIRDDDEYDDEEGFEDIYDDEEEGDVEDQEGEESEEEVTHT